MNVTPTVRVTLAPANTTDPWYVPAERLPKVAVTVIVRLVVRLPEGEIDSQLPPLCVEGVAVNVVGVDAVTDRVWANGFAPPWVPVKVSVVGVTLKPPPAGAMLKVTATEWRAELVAMAIVPLYVPAASPDGFTETLRVRLVVSLPEGETESQGVPPFRTDADTVNVVVRVAVTLTVCDGGADPPAVARNESDDGLTVSAAAVGKSSSNANNVVVPLPTTDSKPASSQSFVFIRTPFWWCPANA